MSRGLSNCGTDDRFPLASRPAAGDNDNDNISPFTKMCIRPLVGSKSIVLQAWGTDHKLIRLIFSCELEVTQLRRVAILAVSMSQSIRC